MNAASNQTRPAMHHLSLHAEDSLSLSEIIQRLERVEPSTLAFLTLSYAELKDSKLQGIMEWLTQPERKSVLPQWACQALFEQFQASQSHFQSQSSPLTSRDQDPDQSSTRDQEWIPFVPKVPSQLYQIKSSYPIRKLILTSNNITSQGLDSISDYVSYNSCINQLSLQGNLIGLHEETESSSFKSDIFSLMKFAKSVSTSTLRNLNLASNPLGSLGLRAFLTSLSSNSLLELDLSTTMPSRVLLEEILVGSGLEVPRNQEGKPMSDDEEGLFISRIISKFLQPVEEIGTHSPPRGCGIKLGDRYGCSKLEKLKLNGNHLGWEGIRMIVGTVVGSSSIDATDSPDSDPRIETRTSARSWIDQLISRDSTRNTSILHPPKTISNIEKQPNRSLTSLEVYATAINESKSLSRVKSIGSLMLESRRAAIRSGIGIGIDGMNDNRQDPHLSSQGSTSTRDRHRRNSNPTSFNYHPRESENSEEERKSSLKERSERGFSQEEMEELSFGHITRENWKRLLGSRVWANDHEKLKTKKIAGETLSLVRILGCGVVDSEMKEENDTSCSSSTSISSSPTKPFPIKKLPPELRVSILREIDSQRILSRGQFLKIIDYGANRRTIGLGSSSNQIVSSSFGASPSSELSDSSQPQAEPSLLPFQDFSSREACLDYRGSLPHFYDLEVLDRGGQDDRAEEGSGGGGAADGAGGALDRRVRAETDDDQGRNKVWRKRKSNQTAERKCFFEMTGCDLFEL